jgi:hypothetical protein
MTPTNATAEIAEEIYDLASTLCVLLAGPDAEAALDGAHRVVLDIRGKAAMLKAGIWRPEIRLIRVLLARLCIKIGKGFASLGEWIAGI